MVCEGNHCRSPIGEALLKEGLGPAFRVRSAGLAALEGAPAAREVERLMTGAGLDITQHRGSQLTAAMALETDLILVMDDEQKDDLERAVPSVRGRIYLLGHWLPAPDHQIADPFRKGDAAYRTAFDHIQRAVAGWLPHLIHQQGPS